MSIYSYLRQEAYVGWLVAGAVLIILSGVYASMGKVYVRFEGWTFQSEKPKRFWCCIAGYFFSGVIFIGLFLHRIGVL
jgi:hypothetical protein